MKRTVEVSTRKTRIFVNKSQLEIHLKDSKLGSVPIEDIGVLILGGTGISVSSGALKTLGEAGATVLACDDSFHPCGIYLPINANTLHSERVRFQAEASAPLKKNLWARIVRAKVRNQAANLRDKPDALRLASMEGRVRSGDEGNIESQAARLYWGHVFSDLPLMPQPFRRHRKGAPPNNLLNYGYAVLRAATARALCAAGLYPVIGIHHSNRYSGFCLADDLMEPFRPAVDRAVHGLAREGRLELTKETKGDLIGVLYADMNSAEGVVTLSAALEKAASTLALAMEDQVKNNAPAPEAAAGLVLPALPATWR
jgi:CRISPR-associated protein Cas1